MRCTFGSLSLDVDGRWHDESRIVFSEPEDESLTKDLAKMVSKAGAPRLSVPAANKPRGNFVVSHRPYTLNLAPKEFVQKELGAMLGALSNAIVGPLEWAPMGNAEAAVQEVELNAEGMALKQLHAMAVVGNRMVHFVGTSTAGTFASIKPYYLQVVASIGLQG